MISVCNCSSNCDKWEMLLSFTHQKHSNQNIQTMHNLADTVCTDWVEFARLFSYEAQFEGKFSHTPALFERTVMYQLRKLCKIRYPKNLELEIFEYLEFYFA